MLVMAVPVVFPVESSMAAGTTMTLSELKAKFPADRYWNGGDNNKTTTTPCTDHGGACSRCNHYYTPNYNDTNIVYYRDFFQCWGFAFKCGHDAFGTTPCKWKKAYNLNNLKAGDIVRYGNGAHVIFVTGVSGNTVTFGDCNSDYRCKIRWGETKQKSELRLLKNDPHGENDCVYVAPSTLAGTSQPTFKNKVVLSNDEYIVESSLASGLNMSVYAHSKENRANIAVHYTAAIEDTFNFTYMNDGTYKILSSHSGKSLDIPGANETTSGKNVQQFTYDGINDQLWALYPATNGYFYVRNKCGGFALDVKGGKSANGTNVQIYTFSKNAPQRWKFLTESRRIGWTLAEGDYRIRTQCDSNTYLKANGTNVEVTKGTSKASVFTVTKEKSGRYLIKEKATGKYLDGAGLENVYDGTNAVVSTRDNGRDQLWILKNGNTSGTYIIINRVNGARLDLVNFKTDEGSNVGLYHKNSSDAQKWVFEPAKPKSEGAQDVVKTQDKEEAKGSAFGLLRAKASKVGKQSVTLTWHKINGATSYAIYGNYCGAKNKYKKLAVVKAGKTSYVVKKIGKKKVKKGRYHKFIVVAVKSGQTLATSKSIHVATKGGKYGNCKKIILKNVRNNKLTLQRGKAFTLKVKLKKPRYYSAHRKVCYETDNPTVATVSSKGVIRAKSGGKANIYVYAQDGRAKKIKVTVK